MSEGLRFYIPILHKKVVQMKEEEFQRVRERVLAGLEEMQLKLEEIREETERAITCLREAKTFEDFKKCFK